MATGWAGDGAVQDQIDATIKDAIERARARARLRSGPSLTHCEECDVPAPPFGHSASALIGGSHNGSAREPLVQIDHLLHQRRRAPFLGVDRPRR